MDDEQNWERLENRIARYKALARLATDEETQRRIYELVSELEQQLRQESSR
jgi:hypothetical protein